MISELFYTMVKPNIVDVLYSGVTTATVGGQIAMLLNGPRRWSSM